MFSDSSVILSNGRGDRALMFGDAMPYADDFRRIRASFGVKTTDCRLVGGLGSTSFVVVFVDGVGKATSGLAISSVGMSA